MARPRKLTPSYLFHKATGKGRAVWTDASGQPHQKLLPGAYQSKESLKAFAQLQLEIEASPLRSPDAKSVGVSVNELMLAYLDHAEQHYRGPDGNQTDEVRHLKTGIQHVRELYGKLPAAEFGPLALKAVRLKFLNLGWCRKTINARVERIRRAFRWGMGEELIPPATYHALTGVDGLQMGRTKARETEPIGPVDDGVVDATLAHVNRHVRGLIEFQRLTGCRPTEACLLRALKQISAHGPDANIIGEQLIGAMSDKVPKSEMQRQRLLRR